jgi:phospholipase/lecithinase/hemolysin
MSVEVLAQLYRVAAKPANQGATLLHPELAGTNYATSGAKNTLVNTPLNGGFPNAVPTVTQIGTYLKHHQPTGQDLFVIDSGANDVGYAVNNLSGVEQAAYIQGEALTLAAAIKKLQGNGAINIIVANQPESFGTPDQRAARQLYDTTLKGSLDDRQVVYAWGDANGVRQDIVANPALFNIQHTTNATGQTACPLPPNPALNITIAWAILCSSSSPVTQPTAFAEYALFADDEHWASGAQKILGLASVW